MKRAARILLVIFTLILLVFTAGLIAASYIFDSKIQDAVRMVNKRQNYFSLNYRTLSSSLLSKKGLLELTVANGSDPVKVSFDVDISFFYSEISADFKKINGSGNLDKKISDAGLPVLDLQGRFSFYPMLAKASLTAKTSAADILFDDGKCRLGENLISLEGRSLKSVRLKLSSAGIKCRGSYVYAGKPSYELNLLGLRLDVKPVINNDKTISFEELSFSLSNLDAEASTLYLIGFKPDETVSDRTLRDGFSLDNLKVNLKETKGSKGFSKIEADGQMDLKFAFPLVKNGVEQKQFDLSSLKYDLTLDSLNLKSVKKLIDSDGLKNLQSVVLTPFSLGIKRFEFKHDNVPSSIAGYTEVSFSGNDLKPKKINLSIKLDVAKSLINDITAQQYADYLNNLSSVKAIDDKGDSYSTQLVFDGSKLTLNGKSPVVLETGEDPFSDDPDISELIISTEN
ncbi:MAG: hypothetical protein ACI4UM_02305 [Succinivibrio sp.]